MLGRKKNPVGAWFLDLIAGSLAQELPLFFQGETGMYWGLVPFACHPLSFCFFFAAGVGPTHPLFQIKPPARNSEHSLQ